MYQESAGRAISLAPFDWNPLRRRELPVAVRVRTGETLLKYREGNSRSLDCAELPKDGNSASLEMTDWPRHHAQA